MEKTDEITFHWGVPMPIPVLKNFPVFLYVKHFVKQYFSGGHCEH